MSDKERVEYILKIRWQLCVRRYYGSDLTDENVSLWKRKLTKLGIWEHEVNDLFNFYDSVFRSARSRRIKREFKKYEGYERACKRLAKLRDEINKLPNFGKTMEQTKHILWLKNKIDIIEGRLYSYRLAPQITIK